MRRLALLLLALPAAAAGAYQPYFTDEFQSGWFPPPQWTMVQGSGYRTLWPNGLTFNYGSGAAFLSNITPPGSGNNYDVRLTIRTVSGTASVYVRAAAEFSSYYEVKLEGGTLQFWKVVNNSFTLLASLGVVPHEGMFIRVVARDNLFLVSTDTLLRLVIFDNDLPAGQPGFGGTGEVVLSQVDLGPLDTAPPSPVARATIRTSSAPSCLDLAWQPPPDDPNGSGVQRYHVWRGTTPNDLIQIAVTYSAGMADCGVSPGTSYTYRLEAIDYHNNPSPPTDFPVATPDAAQIDPRRIGVHALGAHWGEAPSGSERIDMRSRNLNYSLPLVRAMARNGWGVTFGLSYNSQNWRQDAGGVWNLGYDIGYGYGWRVLAGAVTPYWEFWNGIRYYIYTDSTGTEYRLDQNNGNVWTTREGLYVSFDANSNTLYFNDGTRWVMGAMSAGTEPDAGTMYPTIMQDSNGNRIYVRYAAGRGTNWPDSSGRITGIEDVRTPVAGGATFSFGYSGGETPRLTTVNNGIGTSETHFLYYQTRPLCSPFTQECYGNTQVLARIESAPAYNLPHQFQYDEGSPMGPAELTKVTFPRGGHVRWGYQPYTYPNGRTLREVTWRYLKADAGGQTESAFELFDNYPGAAYHISGEVKDHTAQARKSWYFGDPGGPYRGLVISHNEVNLAPYSLMRVYQYTWNTTGVAYITSVRTHLQYESNGLQTKVEQERDAYGNLTVERQYHYGTGAPGPLARTITHTYLSSQPYVSAYIRNRLLTTSVTYGGQTVQVVSNSYDYAPIVGAPPDGVRQWVDPGPNRGLLSRQVFPGGERNWRHGPMGQVVEVNDGQGHQVNVTVSSATNWAAPSLLTPNSASALATALEWSSFLGLTQETGPNNAVARTHYDSNGRVQWTESVHGARTTYVYNDAERWVRAVTGTQWTGTTVDGLGRTVKVERGSVAGYPSNPVWTTVSVQETEYGACACSPLGKVKRVAQPHAPGAAVVWTEYEYDALGRTTKVKHPGGGETRYVYDGDQVTVWDPANKWKTYRQDALGRLVEVREPRPGGGVYTTSYSYNGLDRLTQVVMVRDGVTQVRTFVYDAATQRLASATHPETGTVTYAYNADGTLQSKTDAKGQRIEYSYDSQQRVTRVRRFNGTVENTCEQQEFVYDQNDLYPEFTENGQGRLVRRVWCAGSHLAGCGPMFEENYSYTPGGRVRKKKLTAGWPYWATGATFDRTAEYEWDDQGRLVEEDGRQMVYDAAGRLAEMRIGVQTVATAAWGAAGQLMQMRWRIPGEGWAWVREDRTYNERLQMTRQTVGIEGGAVGMNMEYRFPAAGNNGRIALQRDKLPGGEEVEYQYDELNRLISAVTRGPEWGLTFTYDGFGNRLSQTVVKGSGPTSSMLYNPANNRVVGWSYDANGNVTGTDGGPMQMEYDGYNRMVRAVNVQGGGEEQVTFYDAFGRRRETWRYVPTGWPRWQMVSENVYFAGRLITSGGQGGVDRLGSIRARAEMQMNAAVWVERHKYYPYGEEKPGDGV